MVPVPSKPAMMAKSSFTVVLAHREIVKAVFPSASFREDEFDRKYPEMAQRIIECACCGNEDKDIFILIHVKRDAINSYGKAIFQWKGEEVVAEFRNGNMDGDHVWESEEGDPPVKEGRTVWSYRVNPYLGPLAKKKARMRLRHEKALVDKALSDMAYDKFFEPTIKTRRHYDKFFRERGLLVESRWVED